MGLTYESAGISVKANNRFMAMIKDLVEKTWPGSGKEIGGFAGGDNLIIGSVDGVGTKTQIASLLGVWDTIGIDAVAMSAMDVYVAGGMPSLLYDYLVVRKLEPKFHLKIIEGIIKGCLMAGCKLVGGETAEHPFKWLPHDYFDIATFCIGLSRKSLTPNISSIKPGMKVYGWLSHGLGSNGYSLVRKTLGLDGRSRTTLLKFYSELDCTLGEALLRSTEIHIRNIEKTWKRYRRRNIIMGHAHITGGGLIGNIPRILPRNCKVILDRSKWQRPSIFKLIQETGRIKEEEMDKTFNQGLQVVTIASGEMKHRECHLVGVVEKRKRNEPQVQFIGKFQE